MNTLNIVTKFYGLLQNYGMPIWVMTPLRKMTRKVAYRVLPRYLEKQHSKRINRRSNIIVSFTSFPARINNVWQVVESLKNQTIRPDKIILWLSKEQFPSRKDIPDNLWKCEDELFEIRMVDGDIRSHKKYYYVLQNYPDKDFVTCDDDIYYHPQMLQKLINTSRLYPGCIIANNTSEMKWDKQGKLMPYAEWRRDMRAYSSRNNVQIGIGGVLYPAHCLHDDVTRIDLFTKLAPLADDLWLNLMSRLKGTPVVQTPDYALPLPIESESPTLSSVNNGEGMNDRQIHKMQAWLKDEGLEDVYCQNYNVEATGGG